MEAESGENSGGSDRGGAGDPGALLARAAGGDRVHSAYLLSGVGEAPRAAARSFVRALVCERAGAAPCEDCRPCRLSAEDPEAEPIAIDGTGKRGPAYRHVGDHSDLLWTEREPGGTRVRIGQVRAIQARLQLRATEGGRRAAVIADAEWLNAEAQNALLRLLEEPPPRTTLVLVVANASSLLATIRSRCQRVRFPAEERVALRGDDAEPEVATLVERLDDLAERPLPALLDWAEEYRGARAVAADRVAQLLSVGGEWLCERVRERAEAGAGRLAGELRAFEELTACRRELAQRNANPQMVAERALLAVRRAVT